MVIAQSGGPSMVINQSLVGAVLEARKSPRIGKILGARHGILGILGDDYIDLRKPTTAKLATIAATPSSALDHELAAHHLDQASAYGKSKTSSDGPVGRMARVVDLDERIEDVRQLVGGNSAPCIGDGQIEVIAVV